MCAETDDAETFFASAEQGTSCLMACNTSTAMYAPDSGEMGGGDELLCPDIRVR